MRASFPTVGGNVLARSTVACVFDAVILIDEESIRIWIGSNSSRVRFLPLLLHGWRNLSLAIARPRSNRLETSTTTYPNID